MNSDISGFVADYSGATASDSHGLPFAPSARTQVIKDQNDGKMTTILPTCQALASFASNSHCGNSLVGPPLVGWPKDAVRAKP
jgi:hypothetical protein